MIVEFVGCLPQANIDMELEKLVSFCLWKYVWGDLAASTNAHIIVVIFWISWLPIHFRWIEWIQSFIKTLLVYLISTVNLHYRSLPFDLPHMDSYLLHFFLQGRDSIKQLLCPLTSKEAINANGGRSDSRVWRWQCLWSCQLSSWGASWTIFGISVRVTKEWRIGSSWEMLFQQLTYAYFT